MSPTIVYDAAGTPVFTVGAAGGKTIIMQVVKALIAHFDWGLSAQDSIALGFQFFDKEGLVLEQGTSLEAMKAPLEKMGHKVSISRSEEHTSELQSLMRISYAVFCLQKKTGTSSPTNHTYPEILVKLSIGVSTIEQYVL